MTAAKLNDFSRFPTHGVDVIEVEVSPSAYVGRHRKVDLEETIQMWSQEEPEDLRPVAWPTEEPEDLTEGQFGGELSVKPAGLVRRLVRRLQAVRWSGTRVTAAMASGMVLGATGAGALWQVIR